MLALAALRAEPRISEAFRTGAGLAWHDQDGEEDGVGGLQIWNNETSAWQDVKPVPGPALPLPPLPSLHTVYF